MAKRPAGFIIDVPVTLSVAVRGVSEARAMEVAREFAESMEPSCWYVEGYMEEKRNQGADYEITEVGFESSSEDSCEVLEELEEEDVERGRAMA